MADDSSSLPMDQDDDNDEFFSARETQRQRDSGAKMSPPPRRSDRETPRAKSDASPTPSRKSLKSKKSARQQNFFADEKALQGSDKSGKLRKSEKLRRDKDKWDRRDYKKEELDPAPTPTKKKKEKKKLQPKRESTEEASKTDEETDQQGALIIADLKVPGALPPPSLTRPYFQQLSFIMNSRMEPPRLPKHRYRTLHFAPAQEIVEFDGGGEQQQLPKYTERAITNPWRRWGAHRTLCGQGGFLIDPQRKLIKIERGSQPPPCPPDKCQITLNKNSDIPNSQSLLGSIRVLPGPADAEGYRIGKIVEQYVDKGGFVPKQLAKPPGLNLDDGARRGQPIVVVQTKQKPGSKEKVKKKEKPKKKKKDKKQSSSTDSDEYTDEDGSAEKGRVKKAPEVAKDDSKKGGAFSFLFGRKKSPKPPPAPPKATGSKEPRKRKGRKT